MRVSFKTGSQSGSVDQIMAVWRRADAIERFAGGWVNDHLYNPAFPRRSDDASAFEALTLLAALARETRRLRLGTLVLANLFRHPGLVARRGDDARSPLGGSLRARSRCGWHEREHVDHGIDLMAPGRRLDAFEEALEVIVALLRRGERR